MCQIRAKQVRESQSSGRLKHFRTNVSAPSTAYTLGYSGARTGHDTVRQVHLTRVQRTRRLPYQLGRPLLIAATNWHTALRSDQCALPLVPTDSNLDWGRPASSCRQGLGGLIISDTKAYCLYCGIFSLTRLSVLLPACISFAAVGMVHLYRYRGNNQTIISAVRC
jgi:hypothetical protein